MTTIRRFMLAGKNDVFIEKDTGEEYNKQQLDESFQFEQMEGSVTIKEYYEKLKEFLQNFRMVSNTSIEVKQ